MNDKAGDSRVSGLCFMISPRNDRADDDIKLAKPSPIRSDSSPLEAESAPLRVEPPDDGAGEPIGLGVEPATGK